MVDRVRWASDVVGGFAAGFLAYLVIGTGIGLGVVFAISRDPGSCPTGVIGSLNAGCIDEFASAAWFGIADLPTLISVEPAYFGMVVLGPPPGTTLFLDGDVLFPTLLVLALSVIGFFAWRSWSPTVAWCLAIGFTCETVVLFDDLWRAFSG